MPVVPVIPNIPSLSRSSKKTSASISSDLGKSTENVSEVSSFTKNVEGDADLSGAEGSVASTETSKPASPHVRTVPKSWADLVRTKGPPSSGASNIVVGLPADKSYATKSESVAGILNKFQVRDKESENRIAFLKPRGLVNTGNMCYMNSV